MLRQAFNALLAISGLGVIAGLLLVGSLVLSRFLAWLTNPDRFRPNSLEDLGDQRSDRDCGDIIPIEAKTR